MAALMLFLVVVEIASLAVAYFCAVYLVIRQVGAWIFYP